MADLILFAHGARDPDWARPILAVAEQVKSVLGSGRVEVAFLELMQPDLDTAAARLIAAGSQSVLVVPMFIAQGGHLKRDLPQQIDRLRARYGGVTFELAPPVGEVAAVQQAIAQWVADLSSLR
ncbi:MAG: CbiX/SirB N-terminal domain-containing protein [Rhodocyclaceae bacterium]|nr:CbiX/SirB N-terminal domain-containing protein [Rhodocyclaceae bacterium]MBX3670037.1 CbiX/SirB N-terminal domain-containing protein [Rhodocyclaceae bacterium]